MSLNVDSVFIPEQGQSNAAAIRAAKAKNLPSVKLGDNVYSVKDLTEYEPINYNKGPLKESIVELEEVLLTFESVLFSEVEQSLE